MLPAKDASHPWAVVSESANAAHADFFCEHWCLLGKNWCYYTPMELNLVLDHFLPEEWNKLKSRHWSVYKKLKDDYSTWLWEIKAQTRGTKFEGGVLLTFVYGFTSNQRRDIDSLCTKPLVDSLVDIGLFPDDNKNVIVEVRHTWEYTDHIRTRIIIQDQHPIPVRTSR